MTRRAVSAPAHSAAQTAKIFRSRGHLARWRSSVAAMSRAFLSDADRRSNAARLPTECRAMLCWPRMNGVHDMGGMDGFGAVVIEKNEPVFHEEWEKRMYGLAMILARQFRNTDQFRHAIERIPAPVYLGSSYYERWLNAMMTLLVEKGKVTREELRACGAAPVDPIQPANDYDGDSPKVRRRRARFRVGDRVVARNINATGHTRLPRY